MPEQLLGRIIRTCSHPDDLVLDPFSGSGTTLAVAKKLGRRFLGFELSEQYAHFGRERLEEIAVGDPLTGATEPTKAAFAARQAAGVPKRTPRRKHDKKTAAAAARQTASQPLLASLEPAAASADEAEAAAPPGIDIEGLAIAFEEARDGFSADRLITDPALNAAFAGACRRQGLAGDAKRWNIALLRLRKAGKLAHLVTRRRTERPLAASSPFLHAAEIALQQLLAEGLAESLDEVLCDPERAAIFDERAQRFAAEIAPFELRWAALQLRKLAKSARVQGMHLAVPEADAWEASQPLSACDPAGLPQAPGLYLIEAAHQPLYAGEALDLRARFEVMASPVSQASWQAFADELSVTFHPGCPPAVGPLAGQACLTQRYQPPLNYRELGRPAQ
jgi:site-specific DNA-methyltransferase (adenine-specific)